MIYFVSFMVWLVVCIGGYLYINDKLDRERAEITEKWREIRKNDLKQLHESELLAKMEAREALGELFSPFITSSAVGQRV